MKRSVGVVVLATALLAGACTTSHVDNPTLTTPPSTTTPTASAASPGSGTACSLATANQIRTAFGGTVAPGNAPAATAGAECDWPVTGSNLAGADVTVVLHDLPAPLAVSFDADGAAEGGVTVSGLGTGAYWVPKLAALTVLLTTREITVQLVTASHPEPAAVRADETALAESVVATLPK